MHPNTFQRKALHFSQISAVVDMPLLLWIVFANPVPAYSCLNVLLQVGSHQGNLRLSLGGINSVEHLNRNHNPQQVEPGVLLWALQIPALLAMASTMLCLPEIASSPASHMACDDADLRW